MREKITMTTILWLGARGDLGTTKHDRLMTFTIEQLRSGTTFKVRHGEDHCHLVYINASGRILTVLFGADDDEDTGECQPERLYTREPISIWETLAEWLDRNGLELEGVNDKPDTYYAEVKVIYEHSPAEIVPEVIYDTTPLWLTPMGTISLSPAKDHPKKRYERFTVAKLRNGWDTAVSYDQRMFTGLQDISGFVGRLTMCKMNDDDELPSVETSGLMTYGTLLTQNSLRLVESSAG